MPRKLKGSAIQSGTISTVQLSSGVSSVISQGGGPKISNIGILNSVLVLTDDTAVDTNGGNIKITGSGFVSGCLVYINLVPAMTVSFLSSTEIQASVPATVAGTYPVYVVNPDGGTAIRVPGLTFSASPNWQTSSGLGEYPDSVSITLTLSANLATSYTTVSGSLPPGLSLNGNTGVITGSVTGITVDTTYTFTVRATDAELQDSPRTFTVTITVGDPYFRLTTLLLTGNSGNTVVTDSSTNNFAINVVGDSRASNFSPYLTGWSNYFDGTGDNLIVASNAAFALGSGDFTVECWFYMNNTSTAMCMFENRPTNTSSGINMFVNYSAAGQVQYRDSSGAPISSSITVSANTWNHYALVRSGSTITLWINGQSGGSVTKTTNFTDNTCVLAQDQGGGFNFAGYLSNFRIVKGTALYTANFTPATSTLTSVAGTSLLTCHANRLADGSANNFAITKNGDVSVVSFNPFNLTNTGTTGSMYFDGTGDNLSIDDNVNLEMLNSDFTIELWFNADQITAGTQLIGKSWWTPFYFEGSNLVTYLSSNGSTWDIASNQVIITSPIPKMWYHVAMVRSGTSIKAYANGIQALSLTSGASFYNGSDTLTIAARGSTYYKGYIAEVRIVKGSALYTANFTPPTAPLTAIANTQLLTLQNRQPHNNHSFQDSSSNNFLITRNGNATQGTFSPFSQTGWSLYTNGTNSYASVPYAASRAIGTGDFSIECWINVIRRPADYSRIWSHQGGWGPAGHYGIELSFGTIASNSLEVIVAIQGTTVYGNNLTTQASDYTGNWAHVLMTRQSGNLRGFLNGILKFSATVTQNINGTVATTFGSTQYPGNYTETYISNFRLCIGSVPTLYQTASTTGGTQVFAPPTNALTTTSQGATGVQLLLWQDNRFKDNGPSDVTITGVNSPIIQAFSPFAPTATYSAVTHGGSAYFDGSGDFLTAATNSAVLDSGSGTITVEAWVYLTTNVSGGAFGLLVAPRGTSGTSGLAFGFGNTGGATRLGVSYFAVGYTGTLAVPLNAWTHVAYVLTNATTCKTYLNGVLDATFSLGGTQNVQGLCVAAGDTGASPIVGYISNLRVVKNVTVYTSNFTPPTAPVTNIANTSLLLNFTNGGIYDATSRNDLETVGDAKISTAQSRWGGSSMAFDGTGDYLFSPNTPLVPFGTGDFTIEVWIYPTKISTTNGIAIVSNRTDNTANTTFGCLWSNSNGIYLHTYSTAILNSAVQPTINVWQHVAYVRSSGTLKIYLNGSQIGSSTSFTADISSQVGWYVGKDGTHSASGAETFQGYMQDFRITRGYARYTSNFTPPTSQFRLK